MSAILAASSVKQSSTSLKIMITTLYMLQGMFCGYVSSLPLAYMKIPSYYIMSLFGAAAIPFSFKFVLAPIVEKYSNHKYGKRKTWIVSTIVLCAFFMIFMGIFSSRSSQSYQKITAFFLFLCVLCITLKDIAADSFIIEVLNPNEMSLITFIGDQIGRLITLPLFLTVITSQSIKKYVNRIREIYIICTAFFGLIVIAIIHFKFNEHQYTSDIPSHLQRRNSQQQIQQQQAKSSFKKIFRHYKIFIDPSYKLFRFAILLLLMNQGTEVFMQTYPVQLIKAGIHRQTLMLGQNLCFIPSAIISYFLSRYLNTANCYKYYYICSVIKLAYMILLFLLKIKQENLAIGMYVFLYFIGSMHYFLQNVCLGEESKGKFSGLSITLLLSISNMSRLTVIQKMIMDAIGFDRCVIGCFIFTALLLMVVPKLQNWLKAGKSLRVHQKSQ